MAIRETKEFIKNDKSLKLEYQTILGALYLSNNNFEDSIHSFNQVLQEVDVDDYSQFCIVPSLAGLVFAYIGLENHQKALEEYLKLLVITEDDKNKETYFWLEHLRIYFSSPAGLYTLKISSVQSSNSEFATIDEDNNFVKFKIPLSYRFVLDKDFAKKNNINPDNYPLELSDNEDK